MNFELSIIYIYIYIYIYISMYPIGTGCGSIVVRGAYFGNR